MLSVVLVLKKLCGTSIFHSHHLFAMMFPHEAAIVGGNKFVFHGRHGNWHIAIFTACLLVLYKLFP
jgi:hypothetical protein